MSCILTAVMIGWQLIRLCNEATDQVAGGIVESIRFAPDTGRLLLQLGSQRGKRFVIIGVRPPRPTLYWVNRRGDLPQGSDFSPTEKLNRLRGARLERFDLPYADRLLAIDFNRTKDDEVLPYRLWIAWMGGSGNLWLTDQSFGKVVEMIWKTSAQTLGEPFLPPKPPDLIDWRLMTFPDYVTNRNAIDDLSLAQFLRKRLWGINSELAEFIANEYETQVSTSSGEDEDLLWPEYSFVMQTLRSITTMDSPLVTTRSSRGRAVVLPPVYEQSNQPGTSSLAHLLSRADREEVRESNQEDTLNRARSAITTRIKQLSKRLQTVDRAIADGEQADATKRLGDLLNASRHLMSRGQASIDLPDWETGETHTVPLDPKLTPQDNIEALYKRARKLVRGATQAHSVRPKLQQDLDAANAELQRLESGAVSHEELQSQVDMGSGAGKTAGQKQLPRVPYREFQVGRHTVLVGKSRRDNDELTLHIARPHDVFLHADRVGGSHVIVRRPEKGHEIPQDVLIVAAQAAAYFSKAKHSGVVPVIYTDVRYVNKPRKAPPGLVRVSREQTLMVEPAAPPGYHGDGTAE